MRYIRKSWQEKMHNGKPAKVVVPEKDFGDVPAGATMYIATPEIVNAYIRNIPRGTHVALHQMRKDLAAQHQAMYCCPVTAGIFLRIVAEAAYEDYLGGKKADEITPFWRMIDRHTPTAKKLTCGAAFIKERREREGLRF